ncbi:hypothetical protein EJB05_54663, partial [Eragrostis curvula]
MTRRRRRHSRDRIITSARFQRRLGQQEGRETGRKRPLKAMELPFGHPQHISGDYDPLNDIRKSD